MMVALTADVLRECVALLRAHRLGPGYQPGVPQLLLTADGGAIPVGHLERSAAAACTFWRWRDRRNLAAWHQRQRGATPTRFRGRPRRRAAAARRADVAARAAAR